MVQQLISPELLNKSDKILFIAHLALGDFTYMQNCFRAFQRAYPHIRMHLWVDEVRRTPDASKWPHLKKYSLYDWVRATDLFDRIYDQTYSPQLYQQSILQAQAENYPIVVSFAVLVRHLYAELARKISPHGFVVAQKKRVRLLDIRKHLAYRKLDAFIPAYKSSELQGEHISALYASWFEQLFGITTTPEERFPFVAIPSQWQQRAREDLSAQGVPPQARLAFLNAFSKSEERSWPLERMLELAQRMQQLPAWRDAWFVLNVVPERLEQARALLSQSDVRNVTLFSAEENFFQLPALLALCQLIISVETAVMHLANAVHVPVIALMRQTSPEWVPIDTANSTIISVKSRKGWITEIGVEEVLARVKAIESTAA
ncbi:lipopolysaccharide heptosyltransferase family protein [Herbaspirillum huttiense]|uniref:glycosyltransferase family 9 protein n=1 Tax=Herbaspirillum huttiense TaxID=863372 RepID=UPI001066EFDE|nr:glycosyltransferase family 9 protein [Herbaspirillum huttiense]QBP76804.1 lipopolysaccharide heptosyltransferase family protein [Herbaspirillum huttiense]